MSLHDFHSVAKLTDAIVALTTMTGARRPIEHTGVTIFESHLVTLHDHIPRSRQVFLIVYGVVRETEAATTGALLSSVHV